MTTNTRLRIAIMINSEDLALWQHAMLERIKQGDYAEIVLAVIRNGPNLDPALSARHNIARSMFYKYSNWDRNFFKFKADAFQKKSLSDLFDSIERIHITPETTVWSDRISNTDLARLKEYNLDIIIRLGWRIIRGDVLKLPKYGVWSYHHGDNRVIRGGPPAFWELFNDEHCTGLTLQILNESLDGGQILARSCTATDLCSINRTKNRIYWRSVDVLPRELRKLNHKGVTNYFHNIVEKSGDVSFYSKPLHSENNLSIFDLAKLVGKNLLSYVKEAYFARQYEEKWVLYYRIANHLSTALWRFKKLESPNDRYWADPHVIERNDRYYVFVEEYIYKSRLGRISVIEIDKNGNVSDAIPVLEKNYHMSYPFVFEHENRTFMIPETGANKTVELYECVEFPHRWEFVKNIMEGIKAVDTTLYKKDNRWWLFTNLSETPDDNTHDELSLFTADDLFSNHWQPHLDNAVVSDVRWARPAGALIQYEGKLLRPAQDCSRDYGYGLSMQEVITLDEKMYEERNVSQIKPDWNNDVHGVHTISYVNGLTIVDARTYRKKRELDYKGLNIKPLNSSNA